MNASTTNNMNPTGTSDASVRQDQLDPSNQSIPDAGSDSSPNTVTPLRYSDCLSEEQHGLRLARCYRLLNALAKRNRELDLCGQKAIDHAQPEQNSVRLDNAIQE